MEIFTGNHAGENPLNSTNYRSYSPDLLNEESTSHWFRVKLQNPASEPIDLRISTFFIDSIVVYKKSADTTILLSNNNGYLVPVRDRAVPFYQTSIVPLQVPPHSADLYYFHVINHTQAGKTALKSSLRMGFIAYTNEGFRIWYGWGMSFNFFMAGMMLIIALLNFTLFLISKERNYAYLAFNNLAYLAWIGIYGGWLLSFDLVSDLNLERSIRHVVPTILVTVTYALYAIHFLNFRKNFPNIWLPLLVLVWAHTSMIVPHLFGIHEIPLLINQLVSPVIYLTILVCSFIHWRRGNKLSLYFFLGALALNVGLVVYLLAYNSDDINYLAGHHILEVCFMLEVLLFSIITTQRFINLRTAHAEAVTKREMLEKELSMKNRQLIGLVVEKIRKNESLEVLMKRIDEHVNNKKPATILKKEVSNLLSFDNNWDNFKLHFEEVHPEFFKRLTRRYGTLTTNEYRLAAFLKMGLKNKEIADVSGISVRGVEKAKERLKRKLGGEDLNAVIRS